MLQPIRRPVIVATEPDQVAVGLRSGAVRRAGCRRRRGPPGTVGTGDPQRRSVVGARCSQPGALADRTVPALTQPREDQDCDRRAAGTVATPSVSKASPASASDDQPAPKARTGSSSRCRRSCSNDARRAGRPRRGRRGRSRSPGSCRSRCSPGRSRNRSSAGARTPAAGRSSGPCGWHRPRPPSTPRRSRCSTASTRCPRRPPRRTRSRPSSPSHVLVVRGQPLVETGEHARRVQAYPTAGPVEVGELRLKDARSAAAGRSLAPFDEVAKVRSFAGRADDVPPPPPPPLPGGRGLSRPVRPTGPPRSSVPRAGGPTGGSSPPVTQSQPFSKMLRSSCSFFHARAVSRRCCSLRASSASLRTPVATSRSRSTTPWHHRRPPRRWCGRSRRSDP